MVSSFLRRLFGTPATSTPRTARLGLDVFEDRLVPSTVSFANGVLLIQADPGTADTVTITSVGVAGDGSTGVSVTSSLVGGTTTFGDAAHPVTTIALDLGDGNDSVSVASLSSVIVLVGEGNGNNTVQIGDTRAACVIAGSGQNNITVGNGTQSDAFSSFNLPGTAGAAAFVGWGYAFLSDGSGIFLNGTTGNTFNNSVQMNSLAGAQTFVDIIGNGSNTVTTGAGNDGVSIIGDGSNSVSTGSGDDYIKISGNGNNSVDTGTGNDFVEIDGNGSNSVTTSGSGSITLNGNGSGKDTIDAKNSTATINLNGAGRGSSVVASPSANVFVDGIWVTSSGKVDGVRVRITH